MTTGTFIAVPAFSNTMRTTWSPVPPAGNGLMIRIARLGYSSAQAPKALVMPITTSAKLRKCRLIMPTHPRALDPSDDYGRRQSTGARFFDLRVKTSRPHAAAEVVRHRARHGDAGHGARDRATGTASRRRQRLRGGGRPSWGRRKNSWASA